jgi:tetratricopeptide (TPR) repeat protein
MKPSTELFELIKSLTKSEKRFFKLSSSLQQGDKNYLKIFDVIDKQSEYNEDEIKTLFANATFVKHLPSEKNHLYRLIMKSLRAFHADNSVSSILKHELKNIEILYKKALYRECNKFLIRAKRVAIEYEKFYYLFELLSWEKLLLEEAYEAGEFTTDIDALIKEEQEVIERLRNLAAYHVLYSKINYVFRSGGYVRGEADRALVEEISHHPLIIGRNTAQSKRAATICYYIQGFCATAKADKETAILKFQRVKEILDNNPSIRKDLPKRYMRALSNIMSLQIDLNRLKEAETMMAVMKDFSGQQFYDTEDITTMTFRDTSLAELRIFEKKGEFEKALEIVEHLIKYMEDPMSRHNKEHELVFTNAISSVYFGMGMFKESLQWLNRVLNDNETNLRQDIYSYARLFNLIVHYELGNYDLLEYIIKSTFRYLNKRQRDHQLEVTILNNMKKLARNAGEAAEKEIFTTFAVELRESIITESDQIILSHFNYHAWIESKVTGIPFKEAVKQMYKRQLIPVS